MYEEKNSCFLFSIITNLMEQNEIITYELIEKTIKRPLGTVTNNLGKKTGESEYALCRAFLSRQKTITINYYRDSNGNLKTLFICK
ncbi:hypothetical protein [Enterococcus sp. DIV0691]|uniref:hypothetical protein n=1 Tax=Enterococcus sp. DIV0691 TaxID=2774703 RepID=UPI003F22F9FA